MTIMKRHQRRTGLTFCAALLLPCISSFFVQNPQQPKSRVAFIRDVSSALIIATTTLIPSVASADVTAKLASSAALRNVKSCQIKLTALETSIADQDFLAIRQALREAPCSDLRKSMTTLVKGGDDAPNAQQLAAKYKTFITSLEAMDVKAGLGSRGQKVSVDEMNGYYQAAKTNLREFLVLAEASADIPIQYDGTAAASASQ